MGTPLVEANGLSMRLAVVPQALREAAQAGAACLVATHDADALVFADRILALEDGRLSEVGA